MTQYLVTMTQLGNVYGPFVDGESAFEWAAETFGRSSDAAETYWEVTELDAPF